MKKLITFLLCAFLLPSCESSDAPRLIDPEIRSADLVLPAHAEVEAPELPSGVLLRVMSYNIYGGQFATAEEIGRMIAEHDLDLVGLQECPDEYLAPIAAAAGFEHYVGSGVSLMSKTPLVDAQEVSLNTGRSFVHATSEIGGRSFSVYVAHLGWNLDGNHQCREFVDEHLAFDPLAHLIMVGDFNDEHMSPQIDILEEILSDAFTVAGWYPGQRISWPSTHFDDSEGSQLIDLIFFRRDFVPIVVEVDVINLDPVLSDHKPTTATLLYPATDTPFEEDPYRDLRNPQADWPDPLPVNLLKNPGAEEGVSDWQIEGDGQAVDERDNQTPHAGTGLFTGFREAPEKDLRWSSGTQSIDLSEWADSVDQGKCRLLARGVMATGYTLLTDESQASNKARPYDEGEVIIEGLAGPSGQVLRRASSGRRDTLGWHPFSITLPLQADTRAARLTWMSHHKLLNGASNDAVFDELYLAIDCLRPSNAQLGPNILLGPNLLQNPGAESDDAQAWQSDTWQALPDLEIIGFALFAPLSYSGRALWFAGGPLDMEPGPAGLSTIAQRIELDAYFDTMDADGLALRWGGWLRSWATKTHVTVALEIYDGDGHLWGRVEGGEIHAPEWTHLENLTHIPPGSSAVRLVLEAEVELFGSGVFADELFVIPEKSPVTK